MSGAAGAAGGPGTGSPCFVEELLAERVALAGASFVAHMGDSFRIDDYIEGQLNLPQFKSLRAITNNTADGCGGRARCMGSAYWGWQLLYQEMFNSIHHNTFTNALLDVDLSINALVDVGKSNAAASATGLSLGLGASSVNVVASNIGNVVNQIAQNPDIVFRGPYNTNDRIINGAGAVGMGTAVMAGETISPAELRTMCWFVEGVVTKADPNDPGSADIPAYVANGKNLSGDPFSDPTPASATQSTPPNAQPNFALADVINPFGFPNKDWLNCSENPQ